MKLLLSAILTLIVFLAINIGVARGLGLPDWVGVGVFALSVVLTALMYGIENMIRGCK